MPTLMMLLWGINLYSLMFGDWNLNSAFTFCPEDEGWSKGDELEQMIAPQIISYKSGGIDSSDD